MFPMSLSNNNEATFFYYYYFLLFIILQHLKFAAILFINSYVNIVFIIQLPSPALAHMYEGIMAMPIKEFSSLSIMIWQPLIGF